MPGSGLVAVNVGGAGGGVDVVDGETAASADYLSAEFDPFGKEFL